MIIALAALLAIGVIAFILTVRAKDLPEPEPVSPFQHLDERKAAIYDNLRDLQFEYRVGKLSDSDYQQTKKDLQRELAGVLAEVDRLKLQLSPNGSVPPPPEVKQRDPNIVVFDRYAFDLSQFSGGPQTIKYSVRERYLPQLISPDTDDPQYKEQPGQFRAELHDRLLAPVYPLAFVLIAFAFLGAPRTTRQSAAWSVTAVILAVATLRLIGFACTVFTLKYPAAVAVQYFAVGGTIAASLYAISRGLIIEPPAFLTTAVAQVNTWVTQRVSAIAGTAQ